MKHDGSGAWIFVSFWVAISLGAILVAGCGSDKSCSPNEDDFPPGRETDLLNYYAVAIVDEDIDAYEEALHDNFLFVFTETTADSLGLPTDQPWWGKTAELAAMRDLFEDTTVLEIEFEFTAVGIWSPVELEIEPGDLINGIFTRTTPVMRLTIQEPGQELKTLIYDKTYFDITVVRDPKFPDHILWVIARIEEVLKNPGTPSLRQTSGLIP